MANQNQGNQRRDQDRGGSQDRGNQSQGQNQGGQQSRGPDQDGTSQRERSRQQDVNENSQNDYEDSGRGQSR